MTFEDKNKEIILKPDDMIPEKVAFVQNLYDKANEKINHFDKIKSQHLNYALISFSALLGFIIKTTDTNMQILGCMGIISLMAIFSIRDNKFHKCTSGYMSSMFIFTQVIAYLLNEPKEEVRFFMYHSPGEQKAQWWQSSQIRIYCLLALAGFILGIVIYLKNG